MVFHVDDEESMDHLFLELSVSFIPMTPATCSLFMLFDFVEATLKLRYSVILVICLDCFAWVFKGSLHE